MTSNSPTSDVSTDQVQGGSLIARDLAASLTTNDGQGECASMPGNAGLACGLGSQCLVAPTCDGLSATCPPATPRVGNCALPDCDPNRSVCEAA